MAYSASGLTLVSVGNSGGSRVWTYETSENKTDVDAANYWADAQVRTGDWVLCQCADGGVIVYIAAASSTTSTVTVATPS